MNCSARFAKETDMARGDRPLPFEQLEPRYVEMAERYRQAAIATYRAKRERSQS